MTPLDPALAKRLETVLHDLEDALRDDLAPRFAAARMHPESHAVIVTEWEGDPMTTAYQSAVVRSGTALEQHGIFEEDARRLATRASDFLLRHLWDADHGGWIERAGELEGEKRTITQARSLAALADFLMVSGDFEVAERTVETFKTIQIFVADNTRGGYAARFTRDWTVLNPETRASDAVALAEAFALAWQALGTDIYRRRALETLTPLLAEPRTAVHPTALYAADLVDDPDLRGEIRHAAHEAVDELDAPRKAPACLELWRYTRDANWLERFLNLEPRPLEPGYNALPRALRMETLLLKALYGPRKP